MADETGPRVWDDAEARLQGLTPRGPLWEVQAGRIEDQTGWEPEIQLYHLPESTALQLAACLRGEHAKDLAATKAEIARLRTALTRADDLLGQAIDLTDAGATTSAWAAACSARGEVRAALRIASAGGES